MLNFKGQLFFFSFYKSLHSSKYSSKNVLYNSETVSYILVFFFVVFLFRGFRSLYLSVSFKNSAKNEYFDLKERLSEFLLSR